MKIRRRIKRTTRQYITVALICIIVIGGAAIFTSCIITNQIRQEYEQKFTEVKKEMSQYRRTVFITISDIESGDIITTDNVKKLDVYASQAQETYMTGEGIGKAAILDIPAGTHILDSMLTGNTVSSELREVEFDVIHMNSNVVANDTIDVRIFYPNGEDYTVLAKKTLKSYSGETQSCFLWLSEEEILRMQSAVIDAYLYTGAYLYTTKYIEPDLQTATIVNYEPSIEAINLIRENPNILETATTELSIVVRKALENRLSHSMNKDVTKKQWDLEDDFIYHGNDKPESYEETEVIDKTDQVATEFNYEATDDAYLDNIGINNETTENRDAIKIYRETTEINDKATESQPDSVVQPAEAIETEDGNHIEILDGNDLPELGKYEINEDTKNTDGADMGINKGIYEEIDIEYKKEYFTISEG